MDERPLNAAATTYQDAGDGLSTDKARWDCRTSDEQKTAKTATCLLPIRGGFN